MAKRKFTAAALFSGIGGLCLGFESRGFKTLWATDHDDQVAETYALNFPKTKFLHEDIALLNFDEQKPVDVLHAGFPCQSFSQAGNREGFNDPRGRLFDVMMDKIEAASWKPSVLVFENAPYLKSGDEGRWFERVKLRIKKAGYWFNNQNAFTLSASEDAGLPQKRERLFMVATNKAVFDHNPFVKFPHSPERIDLLSMLQLGEVTKENYFLSEENRYGKWIYNEGKKYEEGRLFQLRKFELREQKQGECPTLTANMGAGGHNVPFLIDGGKLRKLTERECLRLQGFHDNFSFPDFASGAQYRMIGNSVSPLVSELVASFVFEELNKRSKTNGMAI